MCSPNFVLSKFALQIERAFTRGGDFIFIHAHNVKLALDEHMNNETEGADVFLSTPATMRGMHPIMPSLLAFRHFIACSQLSSGLERSSRIAAQRFTPMKL